MAAKSMQTIDLKTQIQNISLMLQHEQNNNSRKQFTRIRKNMTDISLITNNNNDAEYDDELDDDINVNADDDVAVDDAEANGKNQEKELTWISWFCRQKGNDIFCEIEKSFILDNFNLYGIPRLIENYIKTFEILIDSKILCEKYLLIPHKWRNKMVQHLYGIIHSRYVLSVEGIANLAEKYQNGDYGKCSRVYCDGINMLPIGETDELNKSTVKLYCPKCCDIYEPKSTRYQFIDGAYFGTSLPHSFFMTYPILRPIKNEGKLKKKFQPKLYGFKIHSLAYDYQTIQAKQFLKL